MVMPGVRILRPPIVSGISWWYRQGRSESGRRLAQSRTKSRPRRSVGVTAIVHRSADRTNAIEFEVRTNGWHFWRLVTKSAKASNGVSLRAAPDSVLISPIDAESALRVGSGNTGSCSAGYAALIACVCMDVPHPASSFPAGQALFGEAPQGYTWSQACRSAGISGLRNQLCRFNCSA